MQEIIDHYWLTLNTAASIFHSRNEGYILEQIAKALIVCIASLYQLLLLFLCQAYAREESFQTYLD